MLKNYILVALRTLNKNRVHSFINILGLATGVTCCMLIWLFVSNEISYDSYHPKADRIFRIATDAFPPGSPVDAFATSAPAAVQTLRDEFPDFEHVGRLQAWGPAVKHNDTYYYDDRKFFAEAAFFKTFGMELVAGDLETALAQPWSVIITEEMADKYFNGDAMGKTLTMQDTLRFQVTGIVPDAPRNTHLEYDIFVSMPTFHVFAPQFSSHWLSCSQHVYGLVREGVDPDELQARIQNLPMEKYGQQLKQIGFEAALVMQPLTDIHLTSNRLSEVKANGSTTTVTIFSVVALFVLLIGCINFINLSTARSMERAREVGLRKVLGGARKGLVYQFLTESVMITLLACVLAFLAILVALPFFNDLTGEQFAVRDLFQGQMLLGLMAVVVVTGLLAGSYPAFVLSGFPILEVMRGQFKMGSKGVWLRHGLVVVQFAISVALIACTIIVVEQLDHMRTADLGFQKEHIFVVNGTTMPPGTMQQRHEAIKNEIARLPGVRSVTASGTVPGRQTGLLVVSPEGLDEGDSRRMHILNADYDFIDTYGIRMLAGRSFSREFGTDPLSAIMVNEAAVKSLNWGEPEDALGKRIGIGNYQGNIVGVFQDFHFYSLRTALEPMIIVLNPNGFGMLSVALQTDDLPGLVEKIETAVTGLVPGYTFNSFFLDEDFDNQYQSEERLGRVFGIFSFIAILVACMGLFGMVVYVTTRRTREIGIRKVLGARENQIVTLLAKDFMVPVVLGLVLPVPLAWYLMNKWLVDFPYRIEIGIWVFVLAGVIGLMIAMGTVTVQSYRAARLDPAKSIRYE